jgi:hypothetical protein
MLQPHTIVQIDDVVDPEEIRAAQARWAAFDRNSDWLQANIAEVYGNHRGKHICIAGQEVFAADSVNEAIVRATAAHPGDEGWLVPAMLNRCSRLCDRRSF